MRDVLSQGHSGIRYDLQEQSFWRDTFAWAGESISAELQALPEGLAGLALFPDGSRIRRTITIANDGVSIDDEFIPASGDEKLLEFNFIVLGQVVTRNDHGREAVVIKIDGFPSLLTVRFRNDMQAHPFRVFPVRIASSYGIAKMGSRICFSALTPGPGAWQTRLAII
jgi:hypothetical protein